MLRPTKHSHPDKTIINVSLIMLKHLKSKRLSEYNVLSCFVRKNVPGSDMLFIPALNFLFLMGLIEYHQKNDAIEYIGPQ